MATRIVTSLLRELREKLDRVRERELTVALKRLPDLTPAQCMAVEHLSQALMKKFMHEPSVRLRAAAATGGGSDVVEAARYLFALDDLLENRRDKEGSARSGDVRAA